MKFWTIASGIGGIATLVALLIGLIYDEAASKKQLSITALSISELFRGQAAFGGENIGIFSDNNEGRNYALIEIEVMNNGYDVINKEDYSQSIKLNMMPIEKIYYLGIKDVLNIGILPQLRESSGSIIIDPVLLNPGDKFVIEALVSIDLYWEMYMYDRFDWIASIDARIAGVSNISFDSEIHKRSHDSNFVVLLLFSIWIIITIMATIFIIQRRKDFIEWVRNIEKKISSTAHT